MQNQTFELTETEEVYRERRRALLDYLEHMHNQPKTCWDVGDCRSCGKHTRVSTLMSESFFRDPIFFEESLCMPCKGIFPKHHEIVRQTSLFDPLPQPSEETT